MSIKEITVPDLGNFAEVPVIDVLVKAGDVVEVDSPLLTLETDKASMDVPSPVAGTVEAILVSRGDKVSKGRSIAQIRVTDEASAAPSAAATPAPVTPAAVTTTAASTIAAPRAVEPAVTLEPPPTADRHAPLVVLGAGPGGYTAAFRAADLGLQVTLIERWPTLGGVCLNVGCIPSKALLHAAKVVDEAASMAEHGIVFGKPTIDLDKLRSWKNSVVGKLTGGLSMLAKQRKVDVVNGQARFVGPRVLELTADDGSKSTLSFDHCIIAAGSEPVKLPFVPNDPRVIDSTGALELQDLPKRMLVIGGG
ncbi:MAG: FAD-dependent oxidoreductase, partial [Steroidobacteraceae bacterium]